MRVELVETAKGKHHEYAEECRRRRARETMRVHINEARVMRSAKTRLASFDLV